MINAQATILNKGSYVSGTWEGVVIKVLYPNSLPNGIQQNSTSNPLVINSIIVDNNGFIWKVLSIESSGTNYLCTLKEQSITTPTITMEPDILLEKGICNILNSKNLLSPYYHDSYVSTNSFRAAMSYNMKIYSTNIIPDPEPDPDPVPTGNEVLFFEFKNNLTGSTTSTTLTKSGSTLSYVTDGIYVFNNNGFTLSNYNSLLTIPNIYTIEFRFKAEQGHYSPYNSPAIYMKLMDFSSYSQPYGLFLRNGVLCFLAYDCGDDVTKTQIVPEVFYTVKFVKNLTQLQVYVDNVLQLTQIDVDDVTLDTTVLGFFTADHNSMVPEDPFIGTINYVKLYDGIHI